MGSEIVSILALTYFVLCSSLSLSMTFPNLRNPTQLRARLRNLATNSFLSVTKENQGELKFNFKDPATTDDPEVIFVLYYYTDAENAENKIILLVHEATSSCMSMDSDNNIQLVPLKNTTEGVMEDPMNITKADSRFLRISKTGFYYMLNFLTGNGTSNSYLGADSSNSPVIKNVNMSSSFPKEILFSIKELDE